MQKNLKSTMLVLLWVSFSYLVAGQSNDNEKQAILLVSFGTSYPEARSALHAIETKVSRAFPGFKIQWAYTSRIIRKKLAANGIDIPSPDLALSELIDQGYTSIVIQSLHIIPGQEYQYLENIVKTFRNISKHEVTISLGHPLLYSQDDLAETAQNMIQASPPLAKGEAMLWMAHGTKDQSSIYYPALQYALSTHSPQQYLATVEFEPALESVVKQLKAAKIKTIYLQPFMSVAGDHAINDMAGEEPDSWKQQLEAAGFRVECILKGLIENDIFVNQWINRIKTAYYEQ